jgi:ParB/Sulfiredoxin domain
MTERDHPLTVEYRPLEALVPYVRNPRTHSEAQVAEIAASIRAFGFTNPILIDGDNGIIAGHGRLLAARKLGMQQVPMIELAGLSEAEKRAYIIADNKLALNAGWDRDLLSFELGELDSLGFDLALTGFGGDELAGLLNLGNSGLTDPDDIPETPAEPVSRMGDLWLLGRHRLICGDSTDAADVARVLDGVKPHLMVTDPPYGVSYDPAWRERAGLAGKDTVADGTVLNDDWSDWREAWALFPGDVAYVWHGGLHAGTVAESLEASGFGIRSQIVWDKGRLVIGRGDYHWHHEPAYYAVRKGRTGHWEGGRSQTTVWEIPHRRNDTGHGTEKPVECMKRPIENNSSPGHG